LTVRALYFDGSQPKLDQHYPEPAPPAGEVTIRPTRLGVCSTDLELVKGYMGFEGVLGHEFVGIVEAAGDKRGEKWVGQRVVGTINCVCGRCDMCKAGLKEHCRQRSVLGIMNRDGCFAERFTLPAINLLEVPEHVDDDRAVFTEPLAAAFQILRQLTIEGRPFITVLGDGRLGLLCAQVMSQLNATVRLVGKHDEKLQLCEKWGVKHRRIEDVGLRQDQDIVVDCTGSPDGFTTAMHMVRPRGTIVMKTTVAAQQQKAPIDLSPIVVNEINVVGSRCGPFPDALDALSGEKVDVLSLISRRMKLDDGADLLKTAASPDVIKVLFEP
jgi:threonine dehydrogenase-like Zn-dependent dehydrogenase